jgi:hypothetical protein
MKLRFNDYFVYLEHEGRYVEASAPYLSLEFTSSSAQTIDPQDMERLTQVEFAFVEDLCNGWLRIFGERWIPYKDSPETEWYFVKEENSD